VGCSEAEAYTAADSVCVPLAGGWVLRYGQDYYCMLAVNINTNRHAQLRWCNLLVGSFSSAVEFNLIDGASNSADPARNAEFQRS
jgi:hypothetical protein